MDHAEFVRKFRGNEIKANIDKSKAGFFYRRPGLMPQHLRKRQAMIRTFAFGGIFAGIALFFFTPWWLALLVLLGGLSQFPRAQKAAAAGVLEASLADPRVFEYALSGKVLEISEVQNQEVVSSPEIKEHHLLKKR
jgi:hypothetical protein